MRRRGDHVNGICAAGREDMLAQWGPPYAVVEKIDREEGNFKGNCKLNSASRSTTRMSYFDTE